MSMTVAELISELERMPRDARVYSHDYSASADREVEGMYESSRVEQRSINSQRYDVELPIVVLI